MTHDNSVEVEGKLASSSITGSSMFFCKSFILCSSSSEVIDSTLGALSTSKFVSLEVDWFSQASTPSNLTLASPLSSHNCSRSDVPPMFTTSISVSASQRTDGTVRLLRVPKRYSSGSKFEMSGLLWSSLELLLTSRRRLLEDLTVESWLLLSPFLSSLAKLEGLPHYRNKIRANVNEEGKNVQKCIRIFV